MSKEKQSDLLEFIDSFKSLTLSTIDENALPFTSYAPFIKSKNKYYIYISSMAKHFHNLEKNDNCSLFFLEDESVCENIFQRKRVVLQAKSKKLPRDTDEFSALIEIFNKKHGDIINTLKTMKDFYIHEFTPIAGQAVFGFGKAYNIGGKYCEELIVRNNTQGHKS